MSTFQFCPGDSIFHKLDPRVKLLLILSVSIAIFSVSNLVVVSALFVVVFLVWLLCRLPIRNLAKMFKILIPFFIFLILIQALWYPGKYVLVQPLIPTALPVIGGYGQISLDGILHGVMICLRLSVLMNLIPLLTTTTEIETIVLGLVQTGLPYKFAYMATTAMNMVPTFVEEMNTIKNAQLLRACTVFEEGNLAQKLKAYPALIVPLVIGAMRRAQSMGIAMDARSFAVYKERTYINELTWKKKDTVALCLVILAVAGMVALNIVLNRLQIGVYH